MNPNLKQRLLDAAVFADSIYQREFAKAVTEGIAELERMHSVLVEVQRMQAPAVEKLQSLLPLLHRLEHPTAEMRVAMESAVPYLWRRCMEKTHYEVVYLDYPDWRDAVSEPQVVVFTAQTTAESRARYEQLAFEWRYAEMLRVAAEQPYAGEPV